MNAQHPPHKVLVALSAPFFLGMAPIFGKLAIQVGADSFTVAALRTGVAVAFLWVLYSLFFRRYLYIYPAGLIGCIVIGTINGIGSLFYYAALKELDASLVQLINGSYLAFALLLTRIGGQRATWRTLFRVGLAMLALVLITSLNATTVSWVGVGLMLANALMFAGTVVLSQYVLYEMPSPTAALYILTTMGVVVGMVWLAIAPPLSPIVLQEALRWILMLGVTTALSRVAIFAGVKLFGGMQTAILGITEIGVALLLAAVVLGDALTAGQWAGVCLLFASILLIRQQDITPATLSPGALVLANMASVQFHTIAFHRAFGTQATDNAEGTMGTISTEEMQAIQRMMGAELGGIDPFPIGKLNPKQNDLLHGQEVELPSSTRRTKPSKRTPDDTPPNAG